MVRASPTEGPRERDGPDRPRARTRRPAPLPRRPGRLGRRLPGRRGRPARARLPADRLARVDGGDRDRGGTPLPAVRAGRGCAGRPGRPQAAHDRRRPDVRRGAGGDPARLVGRGTHTVAGARHGGRGADRFRLLRRRELRRPAHAGRARPDHRGVLHPLRRDDRRRAGGAAARRAGRRDPGPGRAAVGHRAHRGRVGAADPVGRREPVPRARHPRADPDPRRRARRPGTAHGPSGGPHADAGRHHPGRRGRRLARDDRAVGGPGARHPRRRRRPARPPVRLLGCGRAGRGTAGPAAVGALGRGAARAGRAAGVAGLRGRGGVGDALGPRTPRRDGVRGGVLDGRAQRRHLPAAGHARARPRPGLDDRTDAVLGPRHPRRGGTGRRRGDDTGGPARRSGGRGRGAGAGVALAWLTPPLATAARG
ncbi:hypothetical protein L7F22_000091 [Adiantum nelumboides]|nr:hypothetical protein [Adiantum nelumboides]